MECTICLERFNGTDRRPKSLPCGHSFCLRCLQRLRHRRCPLDNRVFADPLPDNFTLIAHLETERPADAAAARLWCRSCGREAAELCLDEHPVCSLKRRRVETAAPLLEALQEADTALGVVAAELGTAARGLNQADALDRLAQERTALATARRRLQGALAADQAVWQRAQQVEQVAEQGGLSRSVAQLVEDLSVGGATCSLTVSRGAGGAVAWRGEVRPAEDAAARLLLYRLACGGRLQQEGQRPALLPVAARWREITNEQSVEEVASRMEVGARVQRGRDWQPGWTDDGTPPGLGTITRIDPEGTVTVTWDHSNATITGYCMGHVGKYQLRLRAPAPLKPLLTPQEGVHYLEVTTSGSRADLQRFSRLWREARLARVRFLVGLPCTRFAYWSGKVLERVAPHLEGLQLACPLPRHLDVVLTMPHLQSLSIMDVSHVTGSRDQLQRVCQMASLRNLELHGSYEAPLPVLAFEATPPGLRWLRCGVYPLVTALALMTAHAGSLEEVQLVAASVDPYGCPDLGQEISRCGLRKLERFVLLRQTGHDSSACRHDQRSCRLQVEQLWDMLAEAELNVTIMCSKCDRVEFENIV